MNNTMHTASPIPIDSPDMRRAGGDVLSLALMDARNHTLRLLSHYETGLGEDRLVVPCLPELNPPLWELGHIGWFAEWWTSRNLQRQQGRRASPTATRLASIEPAADRWWNSSLVPHADRWSLDLPGVDTIRHYLLDTLESSLELLEKAPNEDDALYFYRLALFHEDMHAEAWAYMAQTLGLALPLQTPGPMTLNAPLGMSATRWALGLNDASGFTFDNEREVHEVSVPEFEIDAQVVSWAQFVEFVDDGGYDQPQWWHPQGWQWLQLRGATEGRRGPRYVEQIGAAGFAGGGGVLQRRFGRPMRMLGAQPVMHVSWWEADAWCRWAGRRLPAEVEWEVAAHMATRRGFQWGEVWEWTGTTFRGYPGFGADPYSDYSMPWFGSHKVLRGASFATRARMKNPKYRNFFLPERDDIFVGFRSCTL